MISLQKVLGDAEFVTTGAKTLEFYGPRTWVFEGTGDITLPSPDSRFMGDACFYLVNTGSARTLKDAGGVTVATVAASGGAKVFLRATAGDGTWDTMDFAVVQGA